MSAAEIKKKTGERSSTMFSNKQKTNNMLARHDSSSGFPFPFPLRQSFPLLDQNPNPRNAIECGPVPMKNREPDLTANKISSILAFKF